MKETFTEQESAALLRVRKLHEELERTKDGLRELRLLSVSISSPNMDGMPKGSTNADKNARVLARIEAQEREIAALSAELDRAKVIARRAIDELTGAFKTFCESYYLDGDPFEVAQAACAMSERQCRRYMQAIK